MRNKNYTLLILLCGLILSGLLIGCGGDDEESPDEEQFEVTAEDLLGSWEVVSIDGEIFQESLAFSYGEKEITVTQNSFVFTANNSWLWNVSWQILIPLDAETVQQFTLTRELNGTYTVSGSTVSLILDRADIIYDPKDLGELLHGQTEEELEEAIILDFGGIQNYAGTIRKNRLTLQGNSEKLVLRKL